MKILITFLLVIFLSSCVAGTDDIADDALLVPQNVDLEVTNKKNYKYEELSKERKIYFSFDSSSLTSYSKAYLIELAQLLQSTEYKKVVVSGHCDERGSKEYNLALGQKRAYQVKSFLESYNITNIKAISYGEEKPVAVGASERFYKLNRRAEIFIR